MFIPCEQIHVTSKFMLQSSKRARIAHHQARFLPLLKNFFSFYRQNSSTTVLVASLFSFPDQMSTLTGCKPGRTAPADIAQSKAYTSKRDSCLIPDAPEDRNAVPGISLAYQTSSSGSWTRSTTKTRSAALQQPSTSRFSPLSEQQNDPGLRRIQILPFSHSRTIVAASPL